MTFTDLINLAVSLVLAVLPIVIGLILLSFAFGIAKFIFKAGDTKAQTEGKDFIKWSIIALFVAFSLYGILTFLYRQFGFQESGHSFGIPTLRESQPQLL